MLDRINQTRRKLYFTYPRLTPPVRNWIVRSYSNVKPNNLCVAFDRFRTFEKCVCYKKKRIMQEEIWICTIDIIRWDRQSGKFENTF